VGTAPTKRGLHGLPCLGLLIVQAVRIRVVTVLE
jgi:hypothetical protein